MQCIACVYQIPASAVEMPDHMMQGLDQCGDLEVGFVEANESASSAYSSAETNRY